MAESKSAALPLGYAPTWPQGWLGPGGKRADNSSGSAPSQRRRAISPAWSRLARASLASAPSASFWARLVNSPAHLHPVGPRINSPARCFPLDEAGRIATRRGTVPARNRRGTPHDEIISSCSVDRRRARRPRRGGRNRPGPVQADRPRLRHPRPRHDNRLEPEEHMGPRRHSGSDPLLGRQPGHGHVEPVLGERRDRRRAGQFLPQPARPQYELRGRSGRRHTQRTDRDRRQCGDVVRHRRRPGCVHFRQSERFDLRLEPIEHQQRHANERGDGRRRRRRAAFTPDWRSPARPAQRPCSMPPMARGPGPSMCSTARSRRRPFRAILSIPRLPAGYVPFNVEDIGGKVYVSYALAGALAQVSGDRGRGGDGRFRRKRPFSAAACGRLVERRARLARGAWRSRQPVSARSAATCWSAISASPSAKSTPSM